MLNNLGILILEFYIRKKLYFFSKNTITFSLLIQHLKDFSKTIKMALQYCFIFLNFRFYFVYCRALVLLLKMVTIFSNKFNHLGVLFSSVYLCVSYHHVHQVCSQKEQKMKRFVSLFPWWSCFGFFCSVFLWNCSLHNYRPFHVKKIKILDFRRLLRRPRLHKWFLSYIWSEPNYHIQALLLYDCIQSFLSSECGN